MEGDGPGIAKAGRLSSLLDDAVRGKGSPGLVRGILGDLEAILDRASHLDAGLSGDSEAGEACLIRAVGPTDIEILRISWKQRKIRDIEVESRDGLGYHPPLPRAEPGRVVERVVPLLWTHLRAGGTLPPGVERFAEFFSLR